MRLTRKSLGRRMIKDEREERIRRLLLEQYILELLDPIEEKFLCDGYVMETISEQEKVSNDAEVFM